MYRPTLSSGPVKSLQQEEVTEAEEREGASLKEVGPLLFPQRFQGPDDFRGEMSEGDPAERRDPMKRNGARERDQGADQSSTR